MMNYMAEFTPQLCPVSAGHIELPQMYAPYIMKEETEMQDKNSYNGMFDRSRSITFLYSLTNEIQKDFFVKHLRNVDVLNRKSKKWVKMNEISEECVQPWYFLPTKFVYMICISVLSKAS